MRQIEARFNMMDILKAGIRVLVLACAFVFAIIGVLVIDNNFRVPGGNKAEVAGTDNSPLFLDNKFCDDPSEPLQSPCSGFIPDVLAATTAYQDIAGDAVVSSGKFGVGTEGAPTAKLDVKGSSLPVLDVMTTGGPSDNTNPIFRVFTDSPKTSTPVLAAYRSSRVGINTANPNSALTVSGDQNTTKTTFTQSLTYAGINILTNYTADAFTPGIFWSTNNDNPTKPKAGIFMKETGSGSYILFMTSNNYGTGLVKQMHLDPSGNLIINGTLTQGSSKDVKKNINYLSTDDYKEILDKLKQVQVVSYKYDSEDDSVKKHIGVIAEDSPDEITSDDKKSIRTSDYLAFLLAAIKQQQKEIEDLKQQIKELKD